MYSPSLNLLFFSTSVKTHSQSCDLSQQEQQQVSSPTWIEHKHHQHQETKNIPKRANCNIKICQIDKQTAFLQTMSQTLTLYRQLTNTSNWHAA